MKTIEIYFEHKKIALESRKWTPLELMTFFKLSTERYTLFKKVIEGFHEFSIEELDIPIELEEHNFFGVFDKAPTYNA